METIRERSLWVVPFIVAVVGGEEILTHDREGPRRPARPDLQPCRCDARPVVPERPLGDRRRVLRGRRAAARPPAPPPGARVLAGRAVGIAVAVAASRVLLDVHWLTDVIGGLALGWAWFAVCGIAFGGRLLRFGAGAEAAATGSPTHRRRPQALATGSDARTPRDGSNGVAFANASAISKS